MKKFVFSLLLLFLLSFSIFAQKLSVSIFNNVKLSTILVTPTKGEYNLVLGDTIIGLKPLQILYISRSGDSILVRDEFNNYGNFKRVTLVGKTGNDVFRIKPIIPAQAARMYDDNITFYVDYDRVMAINLVDREKYLASVVLAETGPNKEEELYKAQALLARTYTVSHANKHQSEGFNLCDTEHCQAYKGRVENIDYIYDAVLDVKDLIVVDADLKPITAAFHANCGGQTANSEDVWVQALPYLKSVPDRFCTSSSNARWEKRIPLSRWYKFLSEQGVDTSKITRSDLNFNPKNRPKYYTVKGTKILTTTVRKYFKLKSAWFSVYAGKKEVRLSGRGYGHGVGMCQDGALQMARKGMSYEEIVKYYFKGVQIVNISKANISTQTDSLKVEPSSVVK
ncbi:SpoIID/LytB domain-containing protein [Tenuifilum thalassicum]|uniref:SpoIID/LytB domain-containing protein n=1 Tax=Tenuifilum thalassicum TaxID=2590900 RepID=A0A7D4AXK0_9BACT|nr:SpoIID/LytB domain-containing protein [Tenuifilum thalassicum]QKG80174.1 SpoIID/LytB domain-containing protein [Tenuifilum thalassicum]